jgi:hypothetical protein
MRSFIKLSKSLKAEYKKLSLKVNYRSVSVIPELRRLRQKNDEFKVSLGYIRDFVSKKY